MGITCWQICSGNTSESGLRTVSSTALQIVAGIPCNRPLHPLLGNTFLLQKGHDLGLDDPVESDGTYLIQYRHPITRVQSNFDHWLVVSNGEDTEASFRAYVASDMDYYVGFWKKWVQRAVTGSNIVRYEDLIAEPAQEVRRLVTALEPHRPVDGEGMQRAVDIAELPSGSVRKPKANVVERDPYTYRYQDAVFYRDVEAATFEQCAGLEYERLYP